MKIIATLMLFNLILIGTCFCQRYQGVNMNRIHQKKTNGPKEKTMGTIEISAGLKWSTGINENSLPAKIGGTNDFEFYAVNTQLSLKYHWKKWSLHSYFLKQHFDANNSYYIQKELSDACIFTYGTGLGLNYKWFSSKNLTFYSGITAGFSRGRNFDIDGETIKRKYNFADYQMTPLGIQFSIKNVGLFTEFSYGTMGFLQIGLSYKFSK